MKKYTFALFLSALLGCDAPQTYASGDADSRALCEDVPTPGSAGGACFVGYECDAGLSCKVGTIGFVCAAPCGTTTGCDCGDSCGGGLCETQCKSSEDCAEGMVCDGEGEDQQRKLHGEIGVLEDRLIDSARAMDGARDSMSDWLAATTLSTNAQLQLADATNVARRAAWEASVQQARLAGAQEDRARTAAAFTANEEAKKRNADRTAKQAELGELMADKSLSPSEKKRKGELMKELNVAAPAKGKKAKKKDPNKLASDQMDFDADVAVYEAKLAKDLRKENLADQEAAFERESALRERRLSDLDREMELLDARGEAEAERIDAEVCVPSCQFAACPESGDACDFASACSSASRCLPLCESDDGGWPL